MKVEPFIHYSIDQIKDMNIPREDYLGKVYFAEWSQSIDQDKILFEDAERLRQELIKYIQTKDGSQDEGVQGLA